MVTRNPNSLYAVSVREFRTLAGFNPGGRIVVNAGRALAHEMASNLIERDEMYHPMRAADAANCWAIAELKFAEVETHRVDHAIDGIARPAIDMLDDICFHDKSQALQRLVADLLRSAGRDADADQWQADADKYEDWEMFMEQEIPGHVHLWDIRFANPVQD